MAETDILQWTGASKNGDWDDGANWSVYAGVPAASTPSFGEGVVCGRLAAWPLTTGPSVLVDVNNWNITRDCEVDIGTPGAPLLAVNVEGGAAGTRILNNSGSGSFYYGGFNATLIVTDSPGSTAFSNVITPSGVGEGLICLSGTVIINDSARPNNLTNDGANLHILGRSVGSIGIFTHTAGVTTTQRDLQTAVVSGDANSIVNVMDEAAVTFFGNAMLTQYGGVVNWQSNGLLEAHTGYVGRFDPTGNPNTTFTVSERTTFNNTFDFITTWENGSIVDTDPTEYGGKNKNAGPPLPPTGSLP